MQKHQLLRGAMDVLHYSGATALARPALRGAGVIFCLHQVLPGGGREQGFAPNAKLECEPQFLEGLINLVRKRGYETLSMADGVARLKHGGKAFAVFTLDDGYRDNAQFAQPAFQKLNCPYTIFVCPRIADGTSEIWWRLLELAVLKLNRFTEQVGGVAYDEPLASDADKWRAWPKLFRAYELLEQHEQRRAIRALCEKHGINIEAYCRSVAMDWDELRAIARDPLCTIGAHTVNHHAVGRMSAEDSFFQMNEARRVIAEKLQRDVLFNAYPYGDEPNATARDFKLAEKAGFGASVTTRKGPCYAGHAAHMQALPRVMISGRYQELRYVDAMMSGLPTILSNRFRTVNVE